MPRSNEIKKWIAKAAEGGGRQLKEVLRVVKQLRESGIAETGYQIDSPFTRKPVRNESEKPASTKGAARRNR